MRNLKRALSLTLASVMLLGMMVVGAGAASYPDVDEKDNIEAIEVLQAVKVMVGDEKGNFGPDQPVNRAQMAVVMALLLDLDYDYYEGSNPFKDVPAWAAPYVAACYANGIVSGYDAYTYGSGDPVTAVQAASMMMRALGYFKYPSDYSNNGGFELATVKQASKIDLFRQINANAKDPLTRNQVAQLALNALKTPIVEADDKTFNLVDGNGNLVVTGGQVNYVVTASNQAFARAIDDAESNGNALNGVNGFIIELGEKLYNGDLKLNNNSTDVFGRPARAWELDGKAIGTYAKKELLKQEWTAKVTGKDLYDLLGKDTINDYDFTITIDGETEENVLKYVANTAADQYYFTKDSLIKTNTKQVGGTGNGVLTQVYVDTAKKDVYIAIINTYLAKADADYSSKKDEVSFTVWSITEYNKTGKLVKDTKDTKSLTVKGEDFAIEDVKDGDIVLVNVAEGEIKRIMDPEVIDKTAINSFKNGSWVKADGTQYDYSGTAQYDTDVLNKYDKNNMKDTEYRLFLDQYGYLAGIEIIDEPDQYVFLTGLNTNAGNLSNETADGRVIFMDGSSEVVKINMNKSKSADGTSLATKTTGNSTRNTWCEYSVNSNNVYTLTEVPNSKATFVKSGENYDVGQSRNFDEGTTANENIVALDKKHVTLNGITGTDFLKVYANDNTVLLSAETSLIYAADVEKDAVIISGVDGLTTGIQSANLNAWNAAAVIKSDASYVKSTTLVNANVSNGVYTLFNDSGYVIAAVVVGEDEGTTTQYAYITSSDANSETWTSGDSKASGDGEWLWTRDVVINGEQTTLTEKGDTNPYIRQMARGEWWEVKFNAEGHVRKASKVTFADTSGKFINNIKLVEASVEKFDTVVLWHDLTAKEYGISVKGNTLQIETRTEDKFGFAVRNDAKIVLAQDSEIYRNGVGTGKYDLMDVITEYDNGAKGLEKAVKDLEANDDFKGYVSAVFEGGVATSVVIWDKTHGKVEIGNEGTAEGIINVDFTTDPGDVVVEWNGDKAPTEDECVSAIIDALEQAGYTVTKVTEDNNGTHFETERTVNGKIVKKTFTYDGNTVEKIEITVDGTDVYIDNTVTKTYTALAALTDENGKKIVKDKGTWVKAKLGSADADYIELASNTSNITISEGDTFEFGYYELTVTEDVADGDSVTNKGSATLQTYLEGKDETAALYIKKEAIDITLDLKNTDASENMDGAMTITSDNGTVTSVGGKNGSKLEALNATKGVKAVVSLAAKDITDDITIELTATDFVGTISMTVNYKGVTKNLTLPENVANWSEVLKAAGWDDSVAATSGKVRLDSDWTKGEAANSTIGSDFKTGGKVTDGLSVTFGCVEMGRTADASDYDGTGAVTWTVNGGAMDVASTNTYFMVAGEEITVAIDLSKLTTAITNAKQKIELGGTVANVEASVTVTGLAAKKTADDSVVDPAPTAVPGATGVDVSLGLGTGEATTAGTVTFTITVGDTDTKDLTLKALA